MRFPLLALLLLAATAAAYTVDEAFGNARRVAAAFADLTNRIACEEMAVGAPSCLQPGLQKVLDAADGDALPRAPISAGAAANTIQSIAVGFFEARATIVERLRTAAQEAFRGASKRTAENEASIASLFDTSSDSSVSQMDALGQAGSFFFTNRTININQGAYKLPPETDADQDVRNALQRAARLDDTFKDIFATTDESAWNSMYFGHANTGAFYRYPGQAWSRSASGEYSSYDPRKRPWYVTAASGPKDVIIIIDTSGSMLANNRLSLAKDAALAVLSSLSPVDFVQVIEFNKAAATKTCAGQDPDPFATRMLRATPANLAALVAFVQALAASGGTNYEAAMDEAFRLLDDSYKAGFGSGCNANFLFLSDGDISEGKKGAAFLTHLQRKLDNPDVSARIFTYTLGDGITNRDVPKQMACRSGGAYSHIPDGGNLIDAMSGFFQLYTFGLTQPDKALLSPPYVFSSVQQVGLTSMLPVFDTDNGDRFVGVVGADMSLQELLATLGNQKPTPDSYVFMVNNEGETLIHPRMKPPSQLDSPSGAVYVDIDDLEGAAFRQAGVRARMVAGESGKATVDTRPAIPRGSPREGVEVRDETVQMVYFFRPVTGTAFSVCLVVPGANVDSTGDVTLPGLGSPPPACDAACIDSGSCPQHGCTMPSYYHRLDVPAVRAVTPGVTSRASLLDGAFYSDNVTTVKLAASAFNDPGAYLRGESDAQATWLSDWMRNSSTPTGSPPGAGIVGSHTAQLLNRMRKTSSLEPLWRAAFRRETAGGGDRAVFARYVGSKDGTFRHYPARRITLSETAANGQRVASPTLYDPTRRPWYYRAQANVGSIVLSAPYLDGLTDEHVLTVSSAVVQGVSSRVEVTATEEVEAVVGVDYAIDDFTQLIAEVTARATAEAAVNVSCGTQQDDGSAHVACFLMDSAGELINHPAYVGNPQAVPSLPKFISYWEPDLALDLIARGYLVQQPAYTNYLTLTRDTFYKVQRVGEGRFTDPLVGGRILYDMRPIIDVGRGISTNLFLIIIPLYPGPFTGTSSAQPVSCPSDACPALQPPASEPLQDDVCETAAQTEKRQEVPCLSITLTEAQLEALRTEKGAELCFEPESTELSAELVFFIASSLSLLLILVIDVVLAKWKRKQLKGRQPVAPGRLIGAALALFDVVTDVLFTVKLSERADSHGLFLPSLAFTAIPVIVNSVLIFQFVTRQLADGPFREWMHKHLNVAVVVIVLSFANPNVLGILTAGYADIALLSAPLSRRSQDQVTVMSMTNNVLEDLPQGIIRVIYLQAELRASRPPSFIDVAGLLTSGAMLLIGMVRRCVLGLILRHGVHEKDGKDDGRGRGISMQGIIRRMTIVDGGGYAPEGEEEEATEVMNPLDTADVEKGSDKKGEVKTAKEAAADCAL